MKKHSPLFYTVFITTMNRIQLSCLGISKTKNYLLVAFFINLFYYGCTEIETTDYVVINESIDLSSRASLSKELVDSLNSAESIDYSMLSNTDASNARIEAVSATSVNYARQASVTAESTFPGYSVLKIKDGSRITTVGGSYSWANNYPAGGRLPESVFLKFTSLKRVDRIDIYTSTGYALKDYTIQYRVSTTGAWINLIIITNNTSVVRSHTFAAVDLLEVQIICQLGPTNQAGYGRLNEVEIYGPAEPTLPTIMVENDMLVFSTEADVEQAVEYLEYKYDQYTNAFVSQYPNLTIDQLNDMEETTGFNDEQPYMNFENGLGINSLRAMLSAAEENWLAGDSTVGPYPDDLYIDDDELRTLVNSYGEIKIGTIYYVFQSDGSYYTYTGDPQFYKTTQSLNPNEIPKNATYYGPTALIPSCRDWDSDGGKKDQLIWRYRYRLGIRNWSTSIGFITKVHAKTKAYRKISGRWKKRLALISVELGGNTTDWGCFYDYPISEIKDAKIRRKRKASEYLLSNKIKNSALWSNHSHHMLPSTHFIFTW